VRDLEADGRLRRGEADLDVLISERSHDERFGAERSDRRKLLRSAAPGHRVGRTEPALDALRDIGPHERARRRGGEDGRNHERTGETHRRAVYLACEALARPSRDLEA